MDVHLYFSLIPEALIASMLPPERFGQYYATGHKFKSKGQALFFEIDPDFRHEYFEIDQAYATQVQVIEKSVAKALQQASTMQTAAQKLPDTLKTQVVVGTELTTTTAPNAQKAEMLESLTKLKSALAKLPTRLAESRQRLQAAQADPAGKPGAYKNTPNIALGAFFESGALRLEGKPFAQAIEEIGRAEVSIDRLYQEFDFPTR